MDDSGMTPDNNAAAAATPAPAGAYGTTPAEESKAPIPIAEEVKLPPIEVAGGMRVANDSEAVAR